MRPEQWIVGRDTGISSRTIWAVMMGVTPERPWVPCDPSDFGRCFRMLSVIPGWRERLPEVAAQYPRWAPLVERWRELEELYVEELQRPDRMAPKLYKRMQELIAAGER